VLRLHYFNDDDQPSVQASAGLTRHFQPKPSFHALRQLQNVLGNYRFGRVVTNEPGRLRVQEYWDDALNIIWVAWSPTGNGNAFTATLDQIPGRVREVRLMPLDANPPPPVVVTQTGGRQLKLDVDESPLYLLFDHD